MREKSQELDPEGPQNTTLSYTKRLPPQSRKSLRVSDVNAQTKAVRLVRLGH